MFCFLSGPCGISPRVNLQAVPLEEGMILSDGKLFFFLIVQLYWDSGSGGRVSSL